jgi:hypothetical protein
MDNRVAEDPFDPAKLRIPSEEARGDWRAHKEAHKVPRAHKAETLGFIKVPLTWHVHLVHAPGSTLWLAQHLLYLNWKAHNRPLKLANAGLIGMGMTRFSKWRALRDLERRGLIKVEGDRRKTPTITVLLQFR